jgi:hypothetical protein
MSIHSKRGYLLALFLVSVLFAAQLHCCVDLNSRGIDSHVCPICSATGTAIATASLIVDTAPTADRLEIFGQMTPVFAVVPRSIAPRAPPLS